MQTQENFLNSALIREALAKFQEMIQEEMSKPRPKQTGKPLHILGDPPTPPFEIVEDDL